MRFEDLNVDVSVGAILAHGHRLGPGVPMLKKGHIVTEADAHTLAAAGVTHVAAVRLDVDDLDEDEAARRVAEAISGPHVTTSHATTGRVNLFAAARGVFVVSRDRLDALNTVDEAITVATVPPYSVVEVGTMVATVKIIPFAVPERLVARAIANMTASQNRPLLEVAPFTKKRAGLVLTTLPGVRDEQLTRGGENQRLRMSYLGGEITREIRVPHEMKAVAESIDAFINEGVDIVLILGASAIVDRRDIVPTAIESIGGAVDHLGMPVDPGNLLLLGHKGTTPIVGVPGCARSLKPSGFDWVLERLSANLTVTARDIMRLGAGGLLAEVASRPAPRQADVETTAKARVAAIVLAAGFSRRMGGSTNKLLEELGGVPLITHVVDALLASKALKPVRVVVGHEDARVRAAVAGKNVQFIKNEAYEEGLGASLRAGITALDEDPGREHIDGALVALGDMPWIRTEHVDALIAAFDPHGPRTICVPIHDRKRGHPVLWSSRHFAEMRKLGGDVGARALLERHADKVETVEVDDAAITLDIDTPEMLADAKKTAR